MNWELDVRLVVLLIIRDRLVLIFIQFVFMSQENETKYIKLPLPFQEHILKCRMPFNVKNFLLENLCLCEDEKKLKFEQRVNK